MEVDTPCRFFTRETNFLTNCWFHAHHVPGSERKEFSPKKRGTHSIDRVASPECICVPYTSRVYLCEALARSGYDCHGWSILYIALLLLL